MKTRISAAVAAGIVAIGLSTQRSALEYYVDLRPLASMRSRRRALCDYSSAAGVPDACARDPSETALGGLEARACCSERLAEQVRNGAARVGGDAVEDNTVRLHVRGDLAS